jgi:DNA polymerase-3 subunit alpha
MSWIPLLNKTDYSLGLSISRTKTLAERCKALGYTACAITERANVFSAINFSDDCIKVGIKPIIGSEFYVADADGKLSRLNILARNYAGWKRLVKMTTDANKKSSTNPYLDFADLSNYTDENLICITGQLGSFLGNSLFLDPKTAFLSDYEGAKELVVPNWKEVLTGHINSLKTLFGERLFLQLNLSDAPTFPANEILSKALRYLGKSTETKCVAGTESFYLKREDAQDQWVILATNLNCTLTQLTDKLARVDDWDNIRFIKSNSYHIHSLDELEGYTQEEIDNAGLIESLCDSYKLTSDPLLPNFECPDGLSPDEYLKKLCVEGWKRKIKGKVPTEKIPEYQARVREELETFAEFGLTTYMLIVSDYVNAAKNRGEIVGPGRGSAAGSLVAYLTNITEVDPIRYDLLFHRFINKGRLQPGKISLADIDEDFGIDKRIDTINYIKDKYSRDNVAAICTFGRGMGRGILSDVLRVHNICNFDEIKNITKGLPDEAAIADQLAAMVEDGEDSGIILWALENNSKELEEFCILTDGKLEGKYAKYFGQAIRLEGIRRSRGKHAAGLVISPHKLGDYVPIIYDDSGEAIVAFDMRAVESLGYLKVDILGVAALTKEKAILNLLKTGNMYAN